MTKITIYEITYKKLYSYNKMTIKVTLLLKISLRLNYYYYYQTNMLKNDTIKKIAILFITFYFQ